MQSIISYLLIPATPRILFFFTTQCKISGINAIFLEYRADHGVPKEIFGEHNICDDSPRRAQNMEGAVFRA
jgi:hypothetical protein